MTALKKKPIGTTSVEVSLLGFGGASIGNLFRVVSDDDSKATIDEALSHNISYFDTAPRYGQGLSERRFGEFLPKDCVISTKVGRVLEPIAPPPLGSQRHGFVDGDPFDERFDYSYDGVMRSFEESLKRLGREKIDILLAHDLGRLTHHKDHIATLNSFVHGGLRAMEELKAQGCIKAIGLGVNETDICLTLMRMAKVDVFLLAGRYSLLEQAPLKDFFPACAAQNISVIIGGPYNSGILVGGYKEGDPAPMYDYAPAPREILERVMKIEAICRDHQVPLAAAALHFIAAHPQVVSIIPGMASAKIVRDNINLLHIPIPNGLWQELKDQGLIDPLSPVPSAVSS